METKIIDLAGGPVDLTADADIAQCITDGGDDGCLLFLQNVHGARKMYYRESADEPALTDKAHCLSAGDGANLVLFSTTPGAWIWAASTGCAAVSAST